MLLEQELTERVIGAAIEVHRILGPGLLESLYEECLCYELGVRASGRHPGETVLLELRRLSAFSPQMKHSS